MFIYAAGKANFANKLKTAYLPEPDVVPVGSTTVARVRYGTDWTGGGDWLPEPAAAGRFARAFLAQTSLRVTVTDADPGDLGPATTPVALLTGTGPVHLGGPQLKQLHDYVAGGGLLVVDACGGSAAFAHSVEADVLPKAFPGVAVNDLPADHPILAGTGPGMSPVDLRLRPFAADRRGVRRLGVKWLAVGRGAVLFCPADVTTGLLGTHTWGIDGYDPDAAYGLVRNAVLWAVARPPGAGPPGPP